MCWRIWPKSVYGPRSLNQLDIALQGHLTDHHRFLLKQWLEVLETVEGKIVEFDKKIEETAIPFATAVATLITIPGIDRVPGV